MKSLKNRLNFNKKEKYNAFFSKITPIEFFLMCIPFMVSLATAKGYTISELKFFIAAFILIFSFSALFLLGLRWRILFFGILLFYGIFFIIYIGFILVPKNFWLLANKDEAIRVGIEAILNGENPYKTTTHLGKTPTELPFTFLFYLPIYIITGGYTFFMNIIVLCVFCIVVFYKFIDTKQNYLILPIISFIIFSDYFFMEAVTNSDLINTSLLLCIILLLIPDQIPKQKKFEKFKYISLYPEKAENITRKIILFSILFGCLLAMRIYFWLIGFVVFLYIIKIYGLKNMIILGLITISTVLIIMLPFVLQDINYFINVNPIGSYLNDFSIWRDYGTIDPSGYVILFLLNAFLNYGNFNGVIISGFLVLFSLLLGLIICENKFHLFLILGLCFLILLFFYLFVSDSTIIRDRVSIAAIPFVFSFLYLDLTKNSKRTIEKNE